MKRMFGYYTLFSLLLVLAACAPGATGTSARNALVASAGETLEVQRGQELYLLVEYPLSEFGLRRNAFSGAFWIPEGVDEESANVATRFDLRDARVPAGWSLTLDQIRLRQEREMRFGRSTGTSTYTVRPVFHLVVPADAELGVSRLRAQLVARGGEPVTVELPVRVRAAQAN